MQANLTISQPFANCVYQRTGQNATIPIAGTGAKGMLSVVVTISVSGSNTIMKQQSLPVDKDGNFGAGIDLPGGWYDLQIGSNASIKVGSGEVFIIFGHSFLQGGHDPSNQRASTDGRVITLLDDLNRKDYKFGQLIGSVGPFHDKPDLWGQFGDKLVKRLGVPVMLYGCAYGGSNILQSYQLIKGEERTSLPPGITDKTSRQPLLPLERVLSEYVPYTGVRAMLVEHGYNDRGTAKETFKQQFNYVFNYLRSTYNKPQLAIVLVQEELTQVPGTLADPTTAEGQKELIANDPLIWQGPNFNASYWPAFHVDHDHMFGSAIDQFASDWDASLTPEFFNNTTTYGPAIIPDVFPAVLYNAPVTVIKPGDFALLGIAAAVLVGVYVWKKKYLTWAFLALALLGLGRATGKV